MFSRKPENADRQPARRRPDNPAAQRPSSDDLSSRYAFRRNRTLTGSSSAKIVSTNELNAELRSPRAHVHHLTSLRRQVLLYFSVVAAASFALYLLVSQLVASTDIRVSSVASAPSADTSAYSEAIESYYMSRPAERLRFALNQPALLAHIQSSRPEVRQVRIEPGSSFGEASVVIQARTPIARWSLADGNQYVDEDGVVFSRNYFDDPSLQIVDNSGLQADDAKLVASNRFLGFVGKVVAKSKASGLGVQKVTIPALTTRQVVVTLEGKDTGYKLSVDRSAGEQVEDIARIVKYMATNDLQPEYVDVRLSGKAFYK